MNNDFDNEFLKHSHQKLYTFEHFLQRDVKTKSKQKIKIAK